MGIPYYEGTPEAPHMHFEKAVDLAADAALAYARYLANLQGAADSRSMSAFFAEAKRRYEEREEEEFC